MDITPEKFGDLLDLHQLDRQRYEEVEQNHQAVLKLLQETRYDGLLLTLPENIAWFTAGGQVHFQHGSGRPETALFINKTGRIVLTVDSVAPQFFDREIKALGFQLKERLWTDGLEDLSDEICRGRAVISDSGFGRTRALANRIDPLRQQFSESTANKYSTTQQKLTQLVNEVASKIQPGQTEIEVASLIAAELIAHQFQPQRLQVYADEHHFQYPHWDCDHTPIQSRCAVHGIVSQAGLYYATTETVDFNAPDQSILQKREQAQVILTRASELSKVGFSLTKLWQEILKTYTELGIPDEWRTAEFAMQLGYRNPEQILVQNQAGELLPNTFWFWQIRIGSTLTGKIIHASE
ncbi:hypothetical protein [Rubinisphaera italica]|uniref:Metallopeptidase family M24 n=1 Tax=Rubinisphaera italica TaxID=2527969 RepID=A0A5C5XKT6_9PLAN|nr:hypothetical protein [Rubinisphaera italica]TWT63550.1 hypothetical protein Pan54_43030 [Rubinisphaera italica]